ncbi:hypothetical protein BS78_06G064800 [Paspalum vaginatum]|nr:hypothetical protein BS78_06G064800 [Paspalum vaginatum]
MDMEHQLQQLLHFSPHEHFMASPSFFAVDDGGHPANFPDGGAGFLEPAVVVEDGGWVEDLMQLGDELFGAEAGGDDGSAGGVDDRQPWPLCDDVDGGSSEAPPPSISFFDGDGSPGSGDQQGAGELASEPHHEDGDDASGATRKRRDRSKTIVSERKRRVRMKEKLYELRSLVPNITKMDKASIIADAVQYIENLQARARKLREEVSALEVRPMSPSRQQAQQQHGRRGGAGRRHQQQERGGAGSGSGARVTHVGAAQVGDGRFFVTVECERRDGVAAPLCAAAESLACFRVESSSIGRAGTDRVVSTLTLKVTEDAGDAAIGEASVKLWMMAALLKAGFRPEARVQISRTHASTRRSVV